MNKIVNLVFGGVACLVIIEGFSCSQQKKEKDYDDETVFSPQSDLLDDTEFIPMEDGITVASDQDPEMALPDNIQLYTYTGRFKNFQRVYMLDEKASYTYYEKEDLSRVYHGEFKLVFTGEGSKMDKKIYGSIKGRFKNGDYYGDWTFVYPFTVYENVPNDYHLVSVPFTAKLTCSFMDGRLNGPFKVVVTNASNNIVGEATLNYENGKRNGVLEFYSNVDPDNSLKEVKGEYRKDKRTGNWTYIYRKNKGSIKYNDSGWETSNYMIDGATGERIAGEDIGMYDLKFGTISLAELQNVIADINNNGKVDGFWSD